MGSWLERLKEHAREHPGAAASLCLHLLLFAIILGLLPSFWSKENTPLPPSVAIEMVPIKNETNIKPKEEVKKTDEKEDEKKKPKPVNAAPIEKPEEKLPEKPKPKPEPKKEAPKPKPKEEKKPEKKPKKEKPKVDPFDAVMKSVDQIKKKDPDQKKQEAPYDASKAPSITQMNLIVGTIKKQVEPHWDIPAGARDAQDMVVTLSFKIDRSGNVSDVKIVDTDRYRSDQVFQVFADSAVRAVLASAPLKDLPLPYYDAWSEIVMKFDPKNMF